MQSINVFIIIILHLVGGLTLKLWFGANGDYSIERPRIYESKEKSLILVVKTFSGRKFQVAILYPGFEM